MQQTIAQSPCVVFAVPSEAKGEEDEEQSTRLKREQLELLGEMPLMGARAP